jgi:hypothetical protein
LRFCETDILCDQAGQIDGARDTGAEVQLYLVRGDPLKEYLSFSAESAFFGRRKPKR